MFFHFFFFDCYNFRSQNLQIYYAYKRAIRVRENNNYQNDNIKNK